VYIHSPATVQQTSQRAHNGRIKSPKPYILGIRIGIQGSEVVAVLTDYYVISQANEHEWKATGCYDLTNLHITEQPTGRQLVPKLCELLFTDPTGNRRVCWICSKEALKNNRG